MLPKPQQQTVHGNTLVFLHLLSQQGVDTLQADHAFAA